MALFDKLKGAVDSAVSEGIGKGIQNAVGKAVESAVKPAADRLAGQAANNLNQATKDLEAAANAGGEAVTGAASQASAAASSAGGMENLGNALAGWATAMQGAAAQAAQNMKECPSCGEVVTADHKFCPRCGSALPEQTIGQGYLCPKCGKQNIPETVYCAECGAMLPAPAQEAAKQMAKWDEFLPQYPKWNLGGTIDIDENGSVNGARAVSLHVGGAGETQLRQYVEALKAAGFIPFYSGDSDIYYKVVDGVCRAFDKTDANQGDFLTFTFFVGDYDKRAAAQAAAQNKADTAKDKADSAINAAKNIFGKFLG